MKKLLLVIPLVLVCGTLAQPECKMNVAVADFYGQNVSEAEAVTVSDFFRSAMVNLQQFNVLERKNMALVLSEQSFQLSGCTDQECAVKMGKLLNVEKVVTGKLTRFEPYYYINAQIIDVESGRIEASEKIQCKKKTALPDKAEEFALLITEVMTGKRQPRQITYTSTSRVFAGAGLGMLNAGDVSLSAPMSKLFFGYRFSPVITGMLAYSATLSGSKSAYLTSDVGWIISGGTIIPLRYAETINGISSFALELEFLRPLGRRIYAVAALGPSYYSYVAEQHFYALDGSGAMGVGISLPGITTTSNTGIGVAARIGLKYYITQDLSFDVQGMYATTSVSRKIDFKNARNEGLRSYFENLQTTYQTENMAGLIGLSFDF